MANLTYYLEMTLTLGGIEAEHKCRVTGTFLPGYRGDHVDPPEGPAFEIDTVDVVLPITEYGKPTGLHDYRTIAALLSQEQLEDIGRIGIAEHADQRSQALNGAWKERRDHKLTEGAKP